MSVASVAKLVKPNKVGWYAIQHTTEEWWVGTNKGVTCYKDYTLARAALTLLWARMGKGTLQYKITTYPGDTHPAGEETFVRSVDEAFKSLKPRKRIRNNHS